MSRVQESLQSDVVPEQTAIQDTYADEIAVCYGCGRHNAHGMHIKTYWDGETGIATYTPDEKYIAFPGVIYGGALASLIDCHSIGTAIAALYSREGRIPGSEPQITCVTANLNISYLKPTPLGCELTLRSFVTDISDRKVVVLTSLQAQAIECVQAEVVAVRISSRMA